MEKTKLKGVLFLLVLILTLLPCTSFAAEFTDVPDSDPLSKDIAALKAGGFISGYPDGSFRTDGTITRAEFVHIANGIFGYSGTSNISNMFSDIPQGQWYYNDVMIAQQAGYVLGYPDGSLAWTVPLQKRKSPRFDRILSLDLSVSEEQAAAVKISDEISPWARNSVLRVLAKGLMTLDQNGCFQGKTNSNRGQVVYASARSLDKIKTEEIAPLSMIGGGGAVEPGVQNQTMISE